MALACIGVCFGGPGQYNLGIEGKILGVVWGVGNCEKIFAGV